MFVFGPGERTHVDLAATMGDENDMTAHESHFLYHFPEELQHRGRTPCLLCLFHLVKLEYSFLLWGF